MTTIVMPAWTGVLIFHFSRHFKITTDQSNSLQTHNMHFDTPCYVVDEQKLLRNLE